MPSADSTKIVVRRATIADVPAIVALLADDPIAATRESPHELTPYLASFAAIDVDPSELLAVADRDGIVVGTMQLSFLPGLSRRGALRAQIEGVRVASPVRGLGIGRVLIRWAITQARARGCTVVQLTTDKRRTETHRFYEALGFTATHEGYKLIIQPSPMQ